MSCQLPNAFHLPLLAEAMSKKQSAS